MLLSLIIPVYKVEQYIEECLESVCSQLTPEIPVEVIVVNDGTPDGSMILARNYISTRYAQLKENFVFIDQKNQGQSVARNNALKVARGDYLAFLDSDDYLINNYFNEVLSVVKSDKPEIVRFSYDFLINENEFLQNKINKYLSVGFNNIDSNLIISMFNESQWYPWLNIYRKDILKDFNFIEGYYFEDLASLPNIFLKIKSIYYIDKSMYCYRVHGNSSLNSKKEENIKKNIESFKYVIELVRFQLSLNQYYGIIYIILLQSYISYLIENKYYIFAYKQFNILKLRSNEINFSILKNRGNRLFYRFGYAFLVIEKILKLLKLTGHKR